MNSYILFMSVCVTWFNISHPSNRYKQYTWAVLHYQESDPVIFYKQTSDLHLTDPCSFPETIACGETGWFYIVVS